MAESATALPPPTLPPLREVIRSWNLDADKRLGQHFLLDLNLTAKIARAAGNLDGINVIEIGPGPGGLTRALIDGPAPRIIAIERDPRCVAALQALVEAAHGRLTVIADDALRIDPVALCPAPRAIVANLPYNVATPLLIGWLRQASAFAGLTLMFQREVALRLVASPRTSEYGRLSVMTQWLTEPALLFDLPPQAFTPPPKVVSSVVHLRPRGRRRLRPAPQDAARGAAELHARPGRPAGIGRHRPDSAGGGAGRRRLPPAGAGLGGQGARFMLGVGVQT